MQLGSVRENIPFTRTSCAGERLFVLKQSPYIAETGRRGFFYFILAGTLQRLFYDADRANAGTRILQWDEWGPANTRVLRNRADLRVDRYVLF